jgi:glucan phosphoethanolaminetransferase (alkaline phosphatase superfamily)
MQQSQSNENENAGAATRWLTNATIASLPVLACFLGGANQKWQEGVVITLLGLFLLVRPPRFSLGLFTNVVLLTLFILAGVVFLPASWFFQPQWRIALVNDLRIQLPLTLTPQPWITLTCLLSFAAGLSWLYVVSAQEIELREARFQLRLFTSGIVFLAAICIAFYWEHTTPLFWHNEGNFGPFVNRNQSGDLFGLAGIMILACAQDDLRRRRKW